MKRKHLAFLIFIMATGIAFSLAVAQNKGGGYSSATVQDSWYDQSVALVVGIGQYTDGWAKLDEPRTDATRVAQALKAQGFEVIMLIDKQANKVNILRQIQTYIPSKIGKSGRFVFYFSGHGQTQIASRTGKQLGYLVPADGRRPGGADDWASYISMSNLRSQINNTISAKHVLIVFDCCFSGTALTKGGGISGTVGHFLGQPAICVLTAGDAGQPTPDGAFSYDFVNAINGSADGVGGMQDGYVTFAEIGTYLQAQIPTKVAGLSPSFGWWDGTSQIVFQYGADPKHTPPSPAIMAHDKSADDTSKIERFVQEERKRRMEMQRASVSENPPDPVKMVLIPGGWSSMGCSPGDKNCDKDEKPRRRVFVDAFYMDVHEVTNSEYQSCVFSGSCSAIDENACSMYTGSKWEKGGTLDPSFKSSKKPVICVCWEQAQNYCSSKGKRLPTEAEYERVLRGDNEGEIFPWGESKTPPPAYGSYPDETGAQKYNWIANDDNILLGYQDGDAETSTVCSFQPNLLGLCDISGNVWEWCQDWYGKNWFSKMPQKNPINNSVSAFRVVRGGSWLLGTWSLRSSTRAGRAPDFRGFNVGFRCVHDAE